MSAPLAIGLLHPDLGLGGAERLVVDAALELQAAGHRVTIYTAHHDRERCFPETVDGTLDVRVRGAFLPPHVAQRLRAPCAIARMAYLAGGVGAAARDLDVVFCDLVAHAIPLVRAISRAAVIYYCHFPDRLLTPPRIGALYRLYRAPIDRLEERAIGRADRVLVNSAFTAACVRRAFPRLAALPLEVVHPGVVVEAEDGEGAPRPPGGGDDPVTLLCMSRFDPRKGLALAVEAFARLRDIVPSERFAALRLIVAGGYDSRLADSRATLAALRARAHELAVAAQVTFVLSPSEAERAALLSRCRCVVYTPEDEHFGYVPIEAMAAARPVVAVNGGGPAETVRDDETGLLRPPTAAAFAGALARLIEDPALAARLGAAGRRHVARHFSRRAFGRRLEAVVRETVARRR